MFFPLSGVYDRANARRGADRPLNLQHCGPEAPFFSAPDRLVEPGSWSLGQDRDHAHDGGARNRRMAARMVRTIAPGTANSVGCNVLVGEMRKTRRPVLISLR